MFGSRLRSLVGWDEAAAHPVERRTDPRRKVLLRAEVFPVADFVPMRVTNVSRTGLAGETDAVLRSGQTMLLSITGNHVHLGTVRWIRGQSFGLDLVGALAICGYEDEVDSGSAADHRPRARRFDVDIPGRIVVGPAPFEATVLDVSQSGLRLNSATSLGLGQQAVIRLSDRPLMLASVRWMREDVAGVQIAERIETLRLIYAY